MTTQLVLALITLLPLLLWNWFRENNTGQHYNTSTPELPSGIFDADQAHLQTECIQAYLQKTAKNAHVKAPITHLIAIHDQIENWEIAALFFDYIALSDSQENQLDELEETNRPARITFQEFNQQLNHRIAFQKIAEITTPIAADIYLLPHS